MQSQTKQTLKIYWQHSRRYPWHVTGILFFLLAQIGFDLFRPYVFRWIVDTLSNDTRNLGLVVTLLMEWSLIAVVRATFGRLLGYTQTVFQPKVMSDLTVTCFDKLHDHSFDFFSNNFVGSLVTKVKRYERGFETIADVFVSDLGRTAITVIFITTILFFQNHLIGTIMLIWALIYVGVIYFSTTYKIKMNIEKAALETEVTGRLADTITNAINIKLFSSFKKERSQFIQKLLKHQFLRIRSWNIDNHIEIFQVVSMLSLEFILLYISLQKWSVKEFTVGDVIFVQSYMSRIFDMMWGLGRYIKRIYEALADSNEMTEILQQSLSVKDADEALTLVAHKGEIVFNNVRFSYKDGVDIFKKFNLHIPAGQRIALVGTSGGGKTTITKLLFRFFDVTSGTVTIDGQNISQVTQHSLRNNLSLVPQDPILFHRSLFDNIKYGKTSATKEEVIVAAKTARAHEFISKFPQGYDTYVGERGVKLSGGERQRVAIARAILKYSPILVLDEATSSLDSESEALIQEALEELMKHKTVMVIAHRLSTIMKMDRIIVIENGKIIEDGKHSELLKARSGTYQKLWHIQAGSFT